MQFSKIPGLQELKSHLTSAYRKGKIAHAQLYAGRPGTAVLPIALAYASYLMCSNRGDHDSCGSCPNCYRIKKLVHPDVYLYFPKVSSTESGKYNKVLTEALPKFRSFVFSRPYGDLEDWAMLYGHENKNILIGREDSREMLKNVSMKSVEGGYKILFLWYPERMNPSAANAILKILEEPPEKTIYLLVTYNYDGLLATIKSRTQLVAIPPNTNKDIGKYLIDSGIDELRAHQVAKLSEGKIGTALKLANEEDVKEYQTFQSWMLDCWNKDLTSLIRRSEDFSKSGKTKQRSSLNYAISIIRNAVVKSGGLEPAVQNEDERVFITKYSNRLGTNKLERIYLLINEAAHHLDRNSNPRITNLNLSLNIIRILNG